MKSLTTKWNTYLIIIGMGTSSYKFNIFLTYALNFAPIKTPKSLVILRLLSLNLFILSTLTSIFALINVLCSSLLTTIFYAMVAKLVDCDYNINLGKLVFKWLHHVMR